MHPPMDIGVFAGREVAHRVQNLARLLRRSGVVEIDQRLAVDFLGQYLEILARCAGIEGRLDAGQGRHNAFTIARGKASSTDCQKVSRIASFSMPSTASLRKARRSMLRASFSGIPRARR